MLAFPSARMREQVEVALATLKPKEPEHETIDTRSVKASTWPPNTPMLCTQVAPPLLQIRNSHPRMEEV